MSPLDELLLSLMYLLQETLEVLECAVAQALEKINPEERDELKVSGKNIVKNPVAWKVSYTVINRIFIHGIFLLSFIIAESSYTIAHCCS